MVSLPQEALKLQQDMRKKKQEMLKTQIDCQKVGHHHPTTSSCPSSSLSLTPPYSHQALINRLEKNRGMKPEERAKVMKTLKELTEKISQLQNEMTPTSQGPKTNHSQVKTKTDVGPAHMLLLLWPMTHWHSLLLLLLQAQKELLDAELDFHKKMSSGEDTTDLKRKLGQLQVEVLLHTCQSVCSHIPHIQLIYMYSAYDCVCVCLRPRGWVCSDRPLLEVVVEGRQRRRWRRALCREGGAGGGAVM